MHLHRNHLIIRDRKNPVTRRLHVHPTARKARKRRQHANTLTKGETRETHRLVTTSTKRDMRMHMTSKHISHHARLRIVRTGKRTQHKRRVNTGNIEAIRRITRASIVIAAHQLHADVRVRYTPRRDRV